MTWKTTLLACFALIIGTPLAAQDDAIPDTQPIELDPSQPEREDFGKLSYRGGLVIEPGEYDIGGISGLTWHEDRLYAVIDDGRWLAITPDEISGRLNDIYSISGGPLLGLNGKKLKKKELADAEAIARDPNGGWLIAFERDHRIWRYDDLNSAASPYEIDLSGLVSAVAENNGIETLATLAEGALICGEFARPEATNCRIIASGSATDFAINQAVGDANPVPTGADCASDGSCYFLLRSYTPGAGNHIAILKRKPGEEPMVLATFDPSLNIDNFEGIAVREQFGKTYLYIVSDNNFSDNQRTLLMKFEDRSAVQKLEQIDDPVPDSDYETVSVILTTTLGEITVRLETERAPITAANFLRYVDEGRFNGTVFYRAMKLDREPMPNGLIQGGPQHDPEKVLDPIAHEPTTTTGLSHTNGAISMAMGEPGTANGDFTIMLQDQVGLDAKPKSEDPRWKEGFAAFGYVTGGMNVVRAIHSQPTDPEKGEGFLKGQMLAEPVMIVSTRRAPVEESEAP